MWKAYDTAVFGGALFLILVGAACMAGNMACESGPSTVPSASGVNQATIVVEAGSDGLTMEQRNVAKRLKLENTPGGISHLYVISAYSGQIILYSTVDGKVTSSGKRLTPTSVAVGPEASCSAQCAPPGLPIQLGGYNYLTSEVLQDDGTYGTSAEYLYWWDTQGRYHQHYVSGGQIIHVSDQPIQNKSIIINLETTDAAPAAAPPP